MQLCMGEDDCGVHAVIYLRQWKQAEKRVLTDKRPENAKNNQNLADFAAENSKVKGERNSNPEKLPWEPTRTESKLCTAELARRGDSGDPLWRRRGAGPFSPCWAVRAVDARAVSMERFAGVTKPAAVKGPVTAPIIPGVAILARPGIA